MPATARAFCFSECKGEPCRRVSTGSGHHECKEKSMFEIAKKTFQWGNHTVTLETGEIARQASGSVLFINKP